MKVCELCMLHIIGAYKEEHTNGTKPPYYMAVSNLSTIPQFEHSIHYSFSIRVQELTYLNLLHVIVYICTNVRGD